MVALGSLIHLALLLGFALSLYLSYKLFNAKRYKLIGAVWVVWIALTLGLVRMDPSAEKQRMQTVEQKLVFDKASSAEAPVLNKTKSYQERMADEDAKLKSSSKERMGDYTEEKLNEDN